MSEVTPAELLKLLRAMYPGLLNGRTAAGRAALAQLHRASALELQRLLGPPERDRPARQELLQLAEGNV